jgi:hypothetical protein
MSRGRRHYALTLSEKHFIGSSYDVYFETIMEGKLSFSQDSDAKVAPLVIAGAAFVGRAAAGGAIAWGVNRGLDKAFPAKK